MTIESIMTTDVTPATKKDVPARANGATERSSSSSSSAPSASRTSSSTSSLHRVGFSNLGREHSFEALRVEGTIPSELVGTFYRNGPGTFDVAGDRNRHWFDGDGAVTAVRIDGATNKALGGAKVVATTGRVKEQRANKRLYGCYNTPMVRPFREIFLRDSKNPANTSVLVHDGRLFALCEAGKPFEISTDDLSTLGEKDFDGAVIEAFSAHPHRVPSRKTTYGFGLGRGRNTRVEVHALEDGKSAKRLTTFTIDGARMNHDFAVTDRHLIFFFAPLYFSFWGVITKKGLQDTSKYREDRGTEIVVIPIDAPQNITRFTVPAFYMEHTVNAFELPGGEIAIDYVHYKNYRAFEDWVGAIANGAPTTPLGSSIQRAIVNPKKQTQSHETLLDEAVELPRITPLLDTERHNVMYALGFGDDAAAPAGVIIKHDLKADRVTRYRPGEGLFPSEAVFIPRAGAMKPTAAEDDGYLLTLVLDGNKGTSHLQILDAQHLDAGPLARCHFDQPLPFGFHGIWQPS